MQHKVTRKKRHAKHVCSRTEEQQGSTGRRHDDEGAPTARFQVLTRAIRTALHARQSAVDSILDCATHPRSLQAERCDAVSSDHGRQVRETGGPLAVANRRAPVAAAAPADGGRRGPCR